MRKNLPITNNEVLVEPADRLVTRTDLKGRIVYANAAFIRISGFSEDELIGRAHNIIRHPDVPSAVFADLWATLQAGRPWSGILKNRCKNGDFYWVQADVAPIHESGVLVGYMSVRRQAARERIEETELAFASINTGEGRFVVRQGTIRPPRPWYIRYNPLRKLSLRKRLLLAAAAIGFYGVFLLLLHETGASSSVVIAAIALFSLIALIAAWWLANDLGNRLERAALLFRQMASGHFDESIPIDRNDEVGTILLGMKIAQIRLGYEIDANSDPLTGLPNRRAFDAVLEHALHDTAATTAVLLMLDLDHFKQYNDSFGHQAGDDVLRKVGTLLRSVLRSKDFAARYGGEEFVVLLHDADQARAMQVGERILAVFRDTDWEHWQVTASMGIAVAQSDELAEQLVRRADQALYKSKANGRNRYTLADAVADTNPEINP